MTYKLYRHFIKSNFANLKTKIDAIKKSKNSEDKTRK